MPQMMIQIINNSPVYA